MKKTHITIALLFCAVTIMAQNKYKRANDLFNNMWYVAAAKQYEALIDKGDRSKEVLQKVGDAYYFNTDMTNAYKWYDRLISEYRDDVAPEYLFRYAHTLEGLGEYKAAEKWMKTFARRTAQNDSRAQNYSQQTLTVADILDLEPQFTLRNLSINTVYSDFGPMYYRDSLVYASAIDSSYYHERKYKWNEQPFLNLYIGRMNAVENDVTTSDNFSEQINTKYHEATIAFSPDERTIYFTRNNYNGKIVRDQEGINHLKLYTASLQKDKKGNEVWTNIKEFPFNSDNYSVGHPAVSPDGKRLYFVSDMPGSIGATDLFVVDILEDGSYSQPINLGDKINTHGREMFPYITERSLYFASDGHLGLGGLDVFQADYASNRSFDTPTNLGAPLNSKLDDFGFIIKENANIGFVCSNRETGKGDDDIYAFERTKARVERCVQGVSGYIANAKTGKKMAGAKVSLSSETGEILEEIMTNEYGDYKFTTPVDCDVAYTVSAQQQGYEASSTTFSTALQSGNTEVPLSLDPISQLIVEENGRLKIEIGMIYFDLNKAYVRSDAAKELDKIVSVMTQYPQMVIKIESHTDARGRDSYNLDLSDRRAKSTEAYIVSQGIAAERIESAIGYGETQLINNCSNGVPCSNEEHQLNRRSEFIILHM